MFRLAKKFVGHVIPGVVRPLHILWNQVIGFLFLVLAVLPIPAIIRDFRDPEKLPRVFLSIPFTLIMAIFGVSSFLRARRISRTS